MPTDAAGRIGVGPGVEIAYTERGAGQPVVMVPGWTMSADVFEHQLDGLSSEFRVVTFDPRSHGRSTHTATGNTYPQHGRDLASIITALDLHDVNLVGWSYGALAAYAYTERSGLARLRSFTAIDQTPKPLGTGGTGEWAEDTLDGFLDEHIGPLLADPAGFAESFVEWALGREPAPGEREWLTGMHLGTEAHAATSLLVSAMLSDYEDLAGRLSRALPCANVVSADDIGAAEPWLADHAPESVLWSITSHLGFWDSPDEFNRRLAEFLRTGS